MGLTFPKPKQTYYYIDIYSNNDGSATSGWLVPRQNPLQQQWFLLRRPLVIMRPRFPIYSADRTSLIEMLHPVQENPMLLMCLSEWIICSSQHGRLPHFTNIAPVWEVTYRLHQPPPPFHNKTLNLVVTSYCQHYCTLAQIPKSLSPPPLEYRRTFHATITLLLNFHSMDPP